MTGKEELRLHLVDAHHWPAVARYEANLAELATVHRAMHDPDANLADLADRIRLMLDQPVEGSVEDTL